MTDEQQFAEIISTGTEILQGLYPDTNAQWLSQQLGRLNIPVRYHHAAPDDAEATRAVVDDALERAALVIVSGGIGPTEDDLNRQLIAAACGRELRHDERAAQMMRERFSRGSRPFPESNLVQALIPERAVPLYNDEGTAPGFIIPAGEGRAAIIALPGPPRELRPMFERGVEPWLRERFPSRQIIKLRILRTYGRAESELNLMIRELFASHPQVTVGLRAQRGQVDIRLTARAATEAEADELLDKFDRQLCDLLGEADIFGRGEEGMADAVARMLLERGLSVSCAESCTGGMLAARLTSVSGSSNYFDESYVTYSDEAKMRVLGVNAETIAAAGAVSSGVAAELAAGVRRVSRADIGLSITGIAGPTGGTAGKPVGLTWFGLAADNRVQTYRAVFPGNREENRSWAATRALDILRRYLNGRPSLK
ncbi:competence/damage-inducible protein A [Candidatus Sumerlaeota bacterium]